MKRRLAFAAITAFTMILTSSAVSAEEQEKKPQLQPSKLGMTPNVHAFGKNLLCGQPSETDFVAAKKRGIKVVLTLRMKNELQWDEAATVKRLGMEFHQLSFRSPQTLTDEIIDKARNVLVDSKKKPVLFHCGSATRVGVIWAAHRVLDDGLSIDDAMKEAKEVGLRTPAFDEKLRDYIRRRRS